MSQLPGRPDLDQLRHQARELQRAAAGGDAGALRRLRLVSGKPTLSAAQLAIAREYGFPSWARLKDETQRRRAAADDAGRAAPEQAPAGRLAPEPPPAGAAAAGPLTADAQHLVDGQYADRPWLRPVLDAVLAALPALGPVTVQARKTLVALVSPRRTFAVVQPTTKTRVDLGLRLPGAEPGGRLQAARNMGSGAATVRIALAGPGDVDAEVRDLMRRAYQQSTAAVPRRPARRPGPRVGTLTVVIEGDDLPGLTCRPEPTGRRHHNIHVALSGRGTDRPALTVPGRPGLAAEPVPGDAPSARWEVPVTVRRDDLGFDFGGPFVGGDRADRHLGLVWGDVPGDGTLRLFRGAKLRLADVDPALIEEAMRPGRRLVARVRLTDRNGNPVCARLRPPAIAWSAGHG